MIVVDTEGPCITRILGLRKTRVKQISRYLRTKGIRKIPIFSNFVNFRPRRTIFTFLEFSAQAKKEYDKNCLNNWTSGASIVKNDHDWILIFIILKKLEAIYKSDSLRDLDLDLASSWCKLKKKDVF